MREIWKDIEGYEGMYQVSNLGNVKGLDRYVKQLHGGVQFKKGQPLKQKLNNSGYKIIILTKHHKQKTFTIHRLVAQAFVPNPGNKPEVNHIDCNKINNRADNLEWCDRKYNLSYAERKEKHDRAVSKTICQFDLNGNFIREWSSIAEAQRELNIGNISYACSGRYKKAGGYIWKYKEVQ